MLKKEHKRKDGTPTALKKDGTHRIAGGGYDKKKQAKWCKGVLQRATELASSMYGKAAEIIVAQYIAFDCGYDGALHVYLAKTEYRKLKLLLAEFADRSKCSVKFKYKYLLFKQKIEDLNNKAIFENK